MSEPVPMETLYSEWDSLRQDILSLTYPGMENIKANLLESDKKIQQWRKVREKKVQEYHPDGVHWPPHPDCPACRKVEQIWIHKAKVRCKELGLEENKENIGKILEELFKKKV
jgi:hypothetical protein